MGPFHMHGSIPHNVCHKLFCSMAFHQTSLFDVNLWTFFSDPYTIN